jgi:Kef-type K+ transport system membrane component KefB
MDFPSTVLALAFILVVATVGAEVAVRLGQPAVVGQLLMGIAVGNVHLFDIHFFAPIAHDPTIGLLADLGVVLLMFSVGLQSTVREMLAVGVSAVLVAITGIVASFALGWLASALILPSASGRVHAMIGALLSSTSVGVTTGVMQELGRSATAEARIILGAAVIDDVVGLAVISAVSEIAQSAGLFSLGGVVWHLGKAWALLLGALALGVLLAGPLFRLAARLHTQGVLLALGLAFCFLSAWFSSAIGLAPVVGAFAAGLILEPTHSRKFVERGEFSLDVLLKPLAGFMVPIFFVVTGMRTDLRSLAAPGALGLTAALIAAAILGKLICALAVRGPIDRIAVGIGMIPRGEIQLLFASALANPAIFSAIVAVVMVTALVAPAALKWRLGPRLDSRAPAGAG